MSAFAFGSENVKRGLDPRTLERSQASSVLNNNSVNHPPPHSWPSHTFILTPNVSSHAGQERLPLGEETPRLGGFRVPAPSDGHWRMQEVVREEEGSGGGGHEEEAENSPYQKAARPLWQRHLALEAQSSSLSRISWSCCVHEPSQVTSPQRLRQTRDSFRWTPPLASHRLAVQACAQTSRGQQL